MKQQYDEEFRRDAVKLWRESGKTKQAIADQLGVHSTTLCGWISQYGDSDVKTLESNDELRAEVKRLKTELHESQQTVALLKKPAPFLLSKALTRTRDNHYMYTSLH